MDDVADLVLLQDYMHALRFLRFVQPAKLQYMQPQLLK